MEKVKIETEMIQLDQFLKWASILQSGGEIRFLLDEQRIFVNGELCSAKRKKLHVGDIVEIKGIGTYEIVGA
ncbi:RNA-binding S4 domain-containing protein [Megasphaera stantonii]|jgi:ribosome-associated protein|uniref:RNA-binding S4 domain-containing protein n=1 Tax=Megasphaera stantonii TaxID=2144175 RepID=A0A346AZI2_9FIRM|nr:RNA-binding S4 domain-containing protein [Megasphaera stantonii]AXL21275.1 RNA-binding S4 domain-containing protein [Megasphaera stantonii]HJE82345.1 RNA-binding S4 domain-containing protein [Megasphaera stantonii]